MSESKKFPSLLGRDPLIILGLAVLFAGIILLIYGFIPHDQPKYLLIATGSVPINDTSGSIIVNPQNYFQAHYSGSGILDRVDCYPSTVGWSCDGYQQVGTGVIYSLSSRYYGLIMVALGVGAIFAGNKLAPFKPRPSYTRPIKVTIDENICVSNSVCVNLVPNVFQLKKQDTPTIFAPVAYVANPQGADNDTIIQAAEMCPTGAIIIEDAETGERIHPKLPKS
ncbi:MAG: ferredoxin [Nitrososphaerota archaeon]|nr:ferredoxin [Nitrososphaerota archaeon]MDG6921789.1 ferredoxin [Nitrososphaerota archaeon]